MNKTLVLDTDNEFNLHREAHLWSKDSPLVQKMLFMVSPQGKSYKIPFPAIFSYQLTALKHLKFFDIALLRDGALPLAKFFLTHRKPVGFSTKILIHEELSFLVPNEWRSQVYYYRTIHKNKITEKDTLLLYGTLDSHASPLSFIEKSLSMINDVEYSHQLLLTSITSLETEEKLFQFDHHYFKAIKTLTQLFSGLDIKNWNEIKSLDFSRVHIHPISLSRFWIADSYLEHFAFSRGASSAISVDSFYKPLEQVMLSARHGLEVHQGFSKKESEQAQWLFDWYDTYEPIVFHKESSLPSETDDHRNSQFCTDELLSFIAFAINRKHE